MPTLPSRWLRLFAIDLRSLALFRIALGALILAGLAARTVDFRVFYTDEGVWPVATAWAEDWAPGMWSLHLLSGSFEWQAALWIAEALAGFALLLGWNTRVVAVLAWVLVASAQKRDVMIVSGAGALLRQFLFWGMWLPLGARWSLDAAEERRKAEGGRMKKMVTETGEESSRPDTPLPPSAFRLPPSLVLSAASAALLLQVVLVYWSNAIYKSDPAWRSTGDAVWMALSQETYARPLGRWLLAWPGGLRALTHGTFWLETLGPLLAFLPWGTARARLLAVGVFIAFHASHAATMYVGFFPFVSIAGWLLFLPRTLWESSSFSSSSSSSETCRERDEDEEKDEEEERGCPSHPLVNSAAAACFALVVGWNLRPAFPAWKMLDPLAHLLRFEQRWAMFAPKPRELDSWCVVVGTDAADRETDLWTGHQPVNWRRPRDFATFFPTDAWKLYLLNLRSGTGPRARLFAEWLARKWSREHPGAVPFVKLEVYHLEESIYARGAMPDNFLIYDSTAESVK